MKIPLFISCILILLAGCATKQASIKTPEAPAVCITNPPNVAITILDSSAPFTCKEKQYIVKRTNYFCQQKKRSPVTELVIYKRIVNKMSNMQVRYYCSWGEYEFREFYFR
jgi:hypothetical protein